MSIQEIGKSPPNTNILLFDAEAMVAKASRLFGKDFRGDLPEDRRVVRDGLAYLILMGMTWEEMERRMPGVENYYKRVTFQTEKLPPDGWLHGYEYRTGKTLPFVVDDPIFDRVMEIRPGMTVLDPMTGPAAKLMSVAARYPETFFLGMDLYAQGLKTAADEALIKGLRHLYFAHHDAADPFAMPDDSVDRVILSGHSTADLPPATVYFQFGEIFRLLKKGGRIWFDMFPFYDPACHFHIRLLMDAAAHAGVRLKEIPVLDFLKVLVFEVEEKVPVSEILLKKANGEMPSEQVMVVVHPPSGPAFREMNDLVVAVIEEGAKGGIPSIFLPEGDAYQDDRYSAVATVFVDNNLGLCSPAFIASTAIFMGGHFIGCLDHAIRSVANAAFRRGEKVFRARLFPDTIYTTNRAGKLLSLSQALADVPVQRRRHFLKEQFVNASFGTLPLVHNASVSLVHGGEAVLIQAGDPAYNLVMDVGEDAEEKTPDKPKSLRPRLAPNLFSLARRAGVKAVARTLVGR